MKISSIQHGVREVSELGKTSGTKLSKTERSSPSCGPSASLTSSQEAKLFSKGVEAAKEAKTIELAAQAEKLASLKEAIHAGSYKIKLSELASKFIKAHFS